MDHYLDGPAFPLCVDCEEEFLRAFDLYAYDYVEEHAHERACDAAHGDCEVCGDHGYQYLDALEARYAPFDVKRYGWCETCRDWCYLDDEDHEGWRRAFPALPWDADYLDHAAASV